MSFDSEEYLTEEIPPFDTFVQIIDKSHVLQAGEGIIISAHQFNIIKAKERFKLIMTVIKKIGYMLL